MADYHERVLEQEIGEYLQAHGWLYSPDDTGYDRERALFPEDVFGWLADTQPEELAKVVPFESLRERAHVLDRLVKMLDTPLESGGGTLNVLRKGFSHISARLDMAQFKPESTLNPVTVERHGKMRLRVMFRKDLGSFVRVYDFLSQIIDYGSGGLEKRSIFYRLFDRRLHDETDVDDIDLSSLTLTAVRQLDHGTLDLHLGDDRVGLHGMTETGSATPKDPKLVALQEVIDRLNELFGAEELSASQPENFVRSLLDRMMEDETLVQQARVNSLTQFSESPDFDEAVVDAVADNRSAHGRIADHFLHTNEPGRPRLMVALAKAFHELAHEADVA